MSRRGVIRPAGGASERRAAAVVTFLLLIQFLLFPMMGRAAAEDNLNVLFIGARDRQLLMTSVLSINYRENYQAVAAFLPANAVLSTTGGMQTLAQIYARGGPEALAAHVSSFQKIPLNYHVFIDQRVLAEVDRFVDVKVDGEEIELATLFEVDASPRDEQILGALMEELTRPAVYFYYLPRLMLSESRRYLATNFSITPGNLWLHYRIAGSVDVTGIPKVILPGEDREQGGQLVALLENDALRKIVENWTGGQPAASSAHHEK